MALRKLLFLLSLLLLTLAVPGWAAEITRNAMAFDGQSRVFYQFIPGDLKSPAPLVVLLHGSGRNGRIMIEQWQSLAAREGIILVGPDAANAAAWSTPGDGPAFLCALAEKIRKELPVDSRRIYLFGHSAGAGFTLLMASYESEYFAAAALHAGALQPQDFAVFDLARRKIPMHIQNGDRDPYFPLPMVRATRDALKQRGLPVELVEMPNHDHNYYVIAERINRTAWEFLKDKTLDGEPRYFRYNFR